MCSCDCSRVFACTGAGCAVFLLCLELGSKAGGLRAASTMSDISKQQKMLLMKLCAASIPAAGVCCCAALPAPLD